jgi:hypothetical protein
MSIVRKTNFFLIIPTLILGLMFFGCLGIFGNDPKSIFLDSISKQNNLKSYIVNYEIKLSLDGSLINSSALAYVKDNNSRIDIDISSLLASQTTQLFQLGNKTYECTSSSYDKKITCKEKSEESSYTAALEKRLQQNGYLVTEVEAAKKLIDEGILILPNKISEEKIAGRSCYLFENVTIDASKAKPWKNESIKALANLKDLGVNKLIMEECFDKETGFPLYTKIYIPIPKMLSESESEIAIELLAKEFTPNAAISEDVFILPSPVIKECSDLEYTKGKQDMYNCYYEFSGNNLSACDMYEWSSDKIKCALAIVNKTGDNRICDRAASELDVSSYYIDDCYEGLAVMRNDSYYCEKIEDEYTKEDCYNELGIYYPSSGITSGVIARTAANGVVTTTRYSIEWDGAYMPYKIVATNSYVEFYVNGTLIANHTSSIPQGPLNAYFGTDYNGYGNVPIVVEKVSITSSSDSFFDDFNSDLNNWNTYTTGLGSITLDKSSGLVNLGTGYGGSGSTQIWSKKSFTLSSTPLIFEANVSAYQEYGGYTYGNGQPRGLRIGNDSNNAIEFISYG